MYIELMLVSVLKVYTFIIINGQHQLVKERLGSQRTVHLWLMLKSLNMAITSFFANVMNKHRSNMVTEVICLRLCLRLEGKFIIFCCFNKVTIAVRELF